MNESTYEIVDDAEDDLVLPVLERDRRWAGYALCDLDEPYRAHARYLVSVRDALPTATVLVYATPSFTSLQLCGEEVGVREILRRADDLPEESFLLVRPADLPAVEERYRVLRRWTMLRMTVRVDDLRPAPDTEARIVSLTSADLPAVQELYALYEGTVFYPFMLEHGVYRGAYLDGRLVAIAGTHALSLTHGIGMIGNVFTHPAYRGRGLATAVSGAVAEALTSQGVRDVGLNVKEDNAPAIAAYRRLGFSVHLPFWEGHVALRSEQSPLM